MNCPRCKTDNLRIEPAPDSFFRRVYCYNCQYWEWLKHFNKKTSMKKTFTKKVVTEEPKLVISYDPGSTSPREDSNLGYFLTKDRSMNSPDSYPEIENIIADTGDYASSQEEHMEMIKKQVEQVLDEKVLAIYPICKYEHSGVSYSLGEHHGFDYSNNGFYIITEKSQKEMGTTEEKWEKVIQDEIGIYNKYVNGEVYSFTLYDDDGEMVDSCCGFYSLEDIKEHLPEEWKDEDLNDYLQFD